MSGSGELFKEKAVEYAVSRFAREQGCLVLKLNVLGQVGWPDRMYLYRGNILFIEFKRPGERVRAIQEHIHERIRQHGFPVLVIDDIEAGKTAVRLHLF
jgi:hypothetical protein